MPDFFLDVGPDDWLKNPKATGAAEAPVPEAPAQTQAAPPAGSGIANTFKAMEGALNADLVKSMDASYQFNLTGKRFCMHLKELVLFFHGPSQDVTDVGGSKVMNFLFETRLEAHIMKQLLFLCYLLFMTSH